MVTRKSWVSENFRLIPESQQRFYRGSAAHFFLVWFRNHLSLGLWFSNKGLGESQILPFATPNCTMIYTHTAYLIYTLGRKGGTPIWKSWGCSSYRLGVKISGSGTTLGANIRHFNVKVYHLGAPIIRLPLNFYSQELLCWSPLQLYWLRCQTQCI